MRIQIRSPDCHYDLQGVKQFNKDPELMPSKLGIEN